MSQLMSITTSDDHPSDHTRGNYKRQRSLEARRAEAERIIKKYPNRIPVVVEKAISTDIANISKSRYPVPVDITIGQLASVIRKKIVHPKEDEELFLYVSDDLTKCLPPSTSTLMSEIYEENADEDGNLYMVYITQSTASNDCPSETLVTGNSHTGGNVKGNFKRRHSPEARRAETKRVREKYPDTIPVIVEKSIFTDQTDISKVNYLVDANITLRQFYRVIRKWIIHLREGESRSIFLYVKDDTYLPPSSTLMSEIYATKADEDGFPYMVYIEGTASDDCPIRGKFNGNFKRQNSLEARRAETKRIMEKYPDRIPVIVEKAIFTDQTDIRNSRWLVPANLTLGQFAYVIRKKIVHLKEHDELFLSVNYTLLPGAATLMSEIYAANADEDGFLYMVYSGDSAFIRFLLEEA